MLTSGHTIQHGVDTKSNPALIRDRVLATDAVNRTFRGGLNDTRPPFQLLNLIFENEKDQYLFERGSLTGLKAYSGVPPYTRTHIIATVGKCIFAGQIIGSTVYMRVIYRELDETLLFQFFAQGETILVINDGVNEGLFWNGQTTQVRKISESIWILNNEGEPRAMPIGNICVYAHGRFWILTEDGILYAGDHLYSKGNSASDEVLLSFTESAYPASGDGFTSPADWGDARGLAVVPRDPSTNGHGEVICIHENGIYSVNPLDDRNQWTTQNIQQTVVTGLGGCSPWSVATINSDIFFRRSDGKIASLRDSYSQKATSLQNRALGGEMDRYLRIDNDETMAFTCSCKDDDRLFFTVNHKVKTNEELGGQHRFAEGMVVFDLSPGTLSSPDQISWEGLWTGPRTTGMTELVFGSEKIAIFSSYDTDGINRLYRIRKFRGDDITGEGNRKIASMYSIGNLFNSVGPESSSLPKTINVSGSIVIYSDAVGEARLAADYKSKHSRKWFQLYKDGIIGLNPDENELMYEVHSDQFNSGSPCSVTEPSRVQGYSFDLRTMIEGTVAIRANLLLGDSREMSPTKTKTCQTSSVIQDDEYELFQYQF
jgi:hypothetical protein